MVDENWLKVLEAKINQQTFSNGVTIIIFVEHKDFWGKYKDALYETPSYFLSATKKVSVISNDKR